MNWPNQGMRVRVQSSRTRRGSRMSVRGAQRSFDLKGGLSSKFAPNRGFLLELPENCMI